MNNARLQQIQLLILDVDGVLTNGQIVYTSTGEELKYFHVRDGTAIKAWQQTGRKLAIISGRSSPAVTIRAKELGIQLIYQGVADKSVALSSILAKESLEPTQVAAMGDDLADICLFLQVGVGIAVANACAELRQLAYFTTNAHGGDGAVREAIEYLLTPSGEWKRIVDRFHELSSSKE